MKPLTRFTNWQWASSLYTQSNRKQGQRTRSRKLFLLTSVIHWPRSCSRCQEATLCGTDLALLTLGFSLRLGVAIRDFLSFNFGSTRGQGSDKNSETK